MNRTNLNILVLFLFSSCSSFQKIELYDAYIESNEKVERIVLNADQTQIWYNLNECGTHEYKTIDNERVLHLNWNKVDCEWVGFGNSWSNFVADDISEMYQKSAIRILVKTVIDDQQFLPFVIGLEDYSGGSSYVFSDTRKFLDGLKINNTQWSEIYIPLWEFDYSQQGVDPYGIKQMVIQLEGAGNVYLKEIKLVPFDKEQYAMLEPKRESLRPKGTLPQLIFPNEFSFSHSSWGIEQDSENYINWTNTKENNRWGINWNDWYPINFRGFQDDAHLYLTTSSHNHSFKLTLSAYNGAHNTVNINDYQASIVDSIFNYKIPLKDFQITERNIQKDRIKQLEFISDEIDVKIYSIKIDK